VPSLLSSCDFVERLEARPWDDRQPHRNGWKRRKRGWGLRIQFDSIKPAAPAATTMGRSVRSPHESFNQTRDFTEIHPNADHRGPTGALARRLVRVGHTVGIDRPDEHRHRSYRPIRSDYDTLVHPMDRPSRTQCQGPRNSHTCLGHCRCPEQQPPPRRSWRWRSSLLSTFASGALLLSCLPPLGKALIGTMRAASGSSSSGRLHLYSRSITDPGVP